MQNVLFDSATCLLVFTRYVLHFKLILMHNHKQVYVNDAGKVTNPDVGQAILQVLLLSRRYIKI